MTPAPPPPARRLAWLLPALGYAAVIFWLSSQSNPLPFMPRVFWTSDKLLHAVEYGGFAVVVTWGLDHVARTGPRTAALLAVVVGAFYGLTDEIHQSFVPGRSADVRDWVADVAGASLGALLAVVFLRHRRARASIRA